jgi:hypothetical protein
MCCCCPAAALLLLLLLLLLAGPREFTALRRYIEEIAEELRGEEID